MSRLIVKNLPKTITEDKIRQIFEEKGTVTDIQLKYTAAGKFRQFAFIGYRNEDEAEIACKTLNQTFINTSKIKVEKCTVLGDENKPKAWSKHAPDSTQKKNEIKLFEKKKPKDESSELLAKYKNDPLFEEFLQVNAPEDSEKLQKLIRENPDEDSAIESDDGNNKDTETEAKTADKQISDLDYMKSLIKKSTKEAKNIQLYTVKLHGLPYKCKKKDLKDFFKPLAAFSIRIPRKIHGIAYVGFKTEKAFNKALLKDRSFIAGKRITVTKYDKNPIKTEVDDTDFKKKRWKEQEEALKQEENIAESGKIFIRNLSYTTIEEDIQSLFSKYGPLAEVTLPVNRDNGKIKGFGVVTFVMPENAVQAYQALDGTIFQGRMLHLLPGKTKEETDKDPEEETTNYKTKKAQKDRAQAGSSHNWNALFLGHDAVAESIAENYNKSKETVLDPHGDGSVAVRLALGETQIVAETRKYLEREGVVLDAFQANPKRSKTVILVKNLPKKTEAIEIKKLFDKFGSLGRIILPPSGITAVVEFVEALDARKAFTKLAYTKFKSTPLYLEWAPENSLTDKIPAKEMDVKEEELKVEEEEIEEIVAKEPEENTTLFVKNLNFQTTDEQLKRHFKDCGDIFYATVATKKDKDNPKNRLSMGYGFVRFYSKKSTDKALKDKQQSVLDGKSLELKRSERTLNEEVKTARKTTKITKQTGTKILVKNVPFQANYKELKELFSTFGEIKALRMPKKLALDSSSHRGFAFVDFVTESDSKRAFEALSQSTHLYGRRLVLEWASNEDGVDEIRKRTAEHFHSSDEPKSKSRKSVLNLEENEAPE